MAATPRTLPEPALRVSDADRDAVVAELSSHYQAGRLNADEFADRSGRALTARTGDDLAKLLTDLPAPAEHPSGGRRRSGLLYLALLVAGLAAAVNIVVSVGTAGHVRVDLLPWWLIVAACFAWRRAARR